MRLAEREKIRSADMERSANVDILADIEWRTSANAKREVLADVEEGRPADIEKEKLANT